MKDKKTLFVVSDIHGHLSQLILALAEAGFDVRDPSHWLICCGDLFDRGRENRGVYDFVMSLKRKVLVRGNHDERLMEVLRKKWIDEYDLYNGMATTLEEFFGKDCINEYGDLDLSEDEPMAQKLCDLIAETVDYYETEHYVFVHGWLPTVKDSNPPRLLPNWRQADREAWHAARFSPWMHYFCTPALPKGKTVVCGHRPTMLASRVDPTRQPSDSSIYSREGFFAIDAGAIRSGRINVLVLED